MMAIYVYAFIYCGVRYEPNSVPYCTVQSNDKRVLTAATQIVRKGLANITLLGDPESVSQDADRLGLDLTGINVVDHMVRLHVHLAQTE